jgi:hypothetical protein
MSHDATRLNIERAREALARARKGDVAAAVRAPRPADLSRLQEEEARKRSIDAHAASFRTEVRQRLGLGEYRGPETPVSAHMPGLMSAPLCDADVCAPVRPAGLESAKALDAGAQARSGRGGSAGAYTPVSFDKGEAASARSGKAEPKKRKKFLGIF